jgi:hypothetical protein
MKLYISPCKHCGNKVYLDVLENTRSELRTRFQSDKLIITCNHCNNKNICDVTEVFAETDSNNAVAGGVIGGIIGLLGGPLGLIIGLGAGAVMGNFPDSEERSKVNFFNHSI